MNEKKINILSLKECQQVHKYMMMETGGWTSDLYFDNSDGDEINFEIEFLGNNVARINYNNDIKLEYKYDEYKEEDAVYMCNIIDSIFIAELLSAYNDEFCN